MSNKQESYILPECCDKCVEADGFVGAKGCSNRMCECHKESHEGVEGLLREFEQRYAPRWKTAIRENETVELPLDAYEHAATIGDAVSWLRAKLTNLNTKKHE